MEVEEVFNCESLIDFNEIIKILNSNCDKKIICFGAGTAASILQRKIFNNYLVFVLEFLTKYIDLKIASK